MTFRIRRRQILDDYNRISALADGPVNALAILLIQTTAAGGLASLFNLGTPNYGADGPAASDERTDTLNWVL